MSLPSFSEFRNANSDSEKTRLSRLNYAYIIINNISFYGCYGSLGLFFHKNLSAFYKDLSAFYKITNISRPLQRSLGLLQRSLGLLTNYKNLSAFFKKNLSALVQKFPERQQIFSFLFFVEFSLQKSSTR